MNKLTLAIFAAVVLLSLATAYEVDFLLFFYSYSFNESRI